MNQLPQMDGRVRLAWSVFGLAAALIGAFMIDRWPAVLLAIGIWTIFQTTIDSLSDRLLLIFTALMADKR